MFLGSVFKRKLKNPALFLVITTIALPLIFTGSISFASHPISSASKTFEPWRVFLHKMDHRLSGEILYFVSELPSNYYSNFTTDPSNRSPLSPVFSLERDRELNLSAQAAIQSTVIKTLNDLHWVAIAKGYLEGLTHARLTISNGISFQGPSLGKLNQDLNPNSPPLLVSDFSLTQFPTPGLAIRTAHQLFETRLNYIPLNEFPLTVRVERSFILKSKIGLNFRWSEEQNDILTTFQMPF